MSSKMIFPKRLGRGGRMRRKEKGKALCKENFKGDALGSIFYFPQNNIYSRM